jgi:hypothetical protein
MAVVEDVAGIVRSEVAGIGEVFHDGMPDDPINCASVTTVTGGKVFKNLDSPGPAMSDVVMQLRVRNEDPATARSLINSAIMEVSRSNETVNSTFFLWITVVSPARIVDRDGEGCTTYETILYVRVRGLA